MKIKWLVKEQGLKEPQTYVATVLGVTIMLALINIPMVEWLAVLLITLVSIYSVMWFGEAILLVVSVGLMGWVLSKTRDADTPEFKNPETLTGTHWISSILDTGFILTMFMGQLYWQAIISLISMMLAQASLWVARIMMRQIMIEKLKAGV